MSENIIATLVKKFNLLPHPEGGYYSETYRASNTVTAASNGLIRSASTAIYFLICPGNCSRLHRITSDEVPFTVWHFYLGDPMTVVELDENHPNHCKLTILGPNITEGQEIQYVVKGGTWFGSFSNPGSQYSLVGCTVAPGFDFEDFELGSRSQLLQQFSHASDIIHKLTEGLP